MSFQVYAIVRPWDRHDTRKVLIITESSREKAIRAATTTGIIEDGDTLYLPQQVVRFEIEEII